MYMDQEDIFYSQLAKSIKAWGWVETELYLLYASIMKGANSHLISVTFNHIESFESKIQLLNSCLALMFSRESNEWKEWKFLSNKARKLNAKRNKIVHEPAIISVRNGEESIAISPSYLNALALVKGQTSHNGPVINQDYNPSSAKVTEDHKIDHHKLRKLEKEFKEFSNNLKGYKENISKFITNSLLPH